MKLAFYEFFVGFKCGQSHIESLKGKKATFNKNHHNVNSHIGHGPRMELGLDWVRLLMFLCRPNYLKNLREEKHG